MTRLLFPVLIAAFFACAVAFLGATITDIGPWYRSLILPRWAPPDMAYGIGSVSYTHLTLPTNREV